MASATVKEIDTRALRHALGCFATGVTVITCADKEGELYGVTANSFSSVSLEPPLVLWSLSNRSSSFDAFFSAEFFNIHVLEQGQIDVSNNFARPGDKFANVNYQLDDNGVPELAQTLARFSCSTYACHEGGDHNIFIGYVVDFEFGDGEPLLFAQGEYSATTLHPARISDLQKGRENNAPIEIEYWL